MRSIAKGVIGIQLFVLMFLASCVNDDQQPLIKGEATYIPYDSTYLHLIPFEESQIFIFKRIGNNDTDTVNILVERIYEETYNQIFEYADWRVDTQYRTTLVYQLKSDAIDAYFPSYIKYEEDDLSIDKAFGIALNILQDELDNKSNGYYRITDTLINDLVCSDCVILNDSTIYSIDYGLIKFSLNGINTSRGTRFYKFERIK